MATFALNLAYPDGQGPRIMAALKAKAKTQANPDPTNAEAIEWFRSRVVTDLRALVRDYDQQAALAAAAEMKAAAANVTLPDIT